MSKEESLGILAVITEYQNPVMAGLGLGALDEAGFTTTSYSEITFGRKIEARDSFKFKDIVSVIDALYIDLRAKFLKPETVIKQITVQLPSSIVAEANNFAIQEDAVLFSSTRIECQVRDSHVHLTLIIVNNNNFNEATTVFKKLLRRTIIKLRQYRLYERIEEQAKDDYVVRRLARDGMKLTAKTLWD